MAIFQKIKVVGRIVMIGCAALTIAKASLITDAAIVERQSQVESELEKSDIRPLGTAEWKYKIENGNIYKRLMDRDTGRWLGNWILVGPV